MPGAAHLEDTSRHRIQCAIKEGYVKVGEKTAKANLLVRPGDVIRFVMPYRRRGVDLIPQDIPLDIVYEDDDVLVVNKPAGMVVHPGHGHFDGTKPLRLRCPMLKPALRPLPALLGPSLYIRGRIWRPHRTPTPPQILLNLPQILKKPEF